MKKLSRVLSVLLIVAMILPGIAQAATLEAGDSIRIAGKDRYETSAKASELAYPEGTDTVVVATGRKYADALAGTVLARAENAPLLLTHSDYLPKEVKAEIERLNAKKVIILGGTGAVGEDVEADLASFVADVSRINEADRYATAVAVAEKAVGKQAKKAYLVSGQVFKDALVIGPVAGQEKAPIFLTEGASLNETTEKALVDFGVEEVVIVGGNNAVADAVQTAVAGKGIAVSRTYGAGAVETSLEVAKNFDNPSKVYVSSAAKLADALVAGYLGAMNNGPVLLTSTADISEDVLAYISANDVEAHVMGGNAVVSDAIVAKVEKAVEEQELKVVSVSAITGSIYKQKDQQLEIEVNGDKVVTVEELVEEGYKVEFLFNKTFEPTSVEKTKGLVNGNDDKLKDGFKYAVKVTPEEGDAITSEWVDVKVIDAVEIVEVVDVGLVDGDDAWELDYITESDGKLKFVALSGKNAEGTLLTDEDEGVILPDVNSIKALNPTIAYANEDKEIVVVPGQTGIAKFEVKFDGAKEPVTVTLDVKAARKPASIKEDGETFRIEANKNASVEYTVLDQYGEENVTAVTPKVLDADKKEVTGAELNNLNLKPGTYTVEFKSGNDKIGSFTVVATDVEEKTPDKYTLTAEKTEVDIKKDEEESKETVDTDLYIDINAFIEDTKLTDFETSDLLVKVSDEDVAKVGEITDKKFTFTAKANSVDRLDSKDVVVTLYTKAGDLVTTHATITITVKNSIKPEYQVTELSIKDGEAIVVKENPDIYEDVYKNAIVDQLTTGDDKNELKADMIEEFVLVNKVEKDGQLVSGDFVITMKKDNGGKVFSFPVEFEALNLVSVDKKEAEGTYTFTVKGEGYDLGRLHVLLHDGSLEATLDDLHDGNGKIQYLVVYASEENVYGSEEAENNVTGFGVEAKYDEATKTWTLTVAGETVNEKIGNHANYPNDGNIEDIGLLFNLSNESNRNVRSNVIANDFSVAE